MIEFLNAVSFIFNYTYFKFDNRYFKQIFGMLMRSPLSPTLADLVIQDLKKVHSVNIDIPVYYRYDILFAILTIRFMKY